ncbi:MAG: response regulator transcription factor [Sedimentisphaerales bacterium]|nr:response regulator transcription factor [Sedimentisphaerales bacterium]
MISQRAWDNMKAMTRRYDVFFVDDDAGIRRLISEELEEINCAVSCFANGSDCLERLGKENCNLLITDVKMPGMDGLELIRRARRVVPWIPAMVITGFGDVPMAVRAIKLGAVDFIEKPLDRYEFLYKVKTILSQNDFADVPAGQNLTKTEKKILKLILAGKSNKDIAHILDRAIRTVELHRHHIMQKFKADNVVDLVRKSAGMDLSDID